MGLFVCLNLSVTAFSFFACLSLPALPPSINMAATAAHRYYCNFLETVLFYHFYLIKYYLLIDLHDMVAVIGQPFKMD